MGETVVRWGSGWCLAALAAWLSWVLFHSGAPRAVWLSVQLVGGSVAWAVAASGVGRSNSADKVGPRWRDGVAWAVAFGIGSLHFWTENGFSWPLVPGQINIFQANNLVAPVGLHVNRSLSIAIGPAPMMTAAALACFIGGALQVALSSRHLPSAGAPRAAVAGATWAAGGLIGGYVSFIAMYIVLAVAGGAGIVGSGVVAVGAGAFAGGLAAATVGVPTASWVSTQQPLGRVLTAFGVVTVLVLCWTVIATLIGAPSKTWHGDRVRAQVRGTLGEHSFVVEVNGNVISAEFVPHLPERDRWLESAALAVIRATDRVNIAIAPIETGADEPVFVGFERRYRVRPVAGPVPGSISGLIITREPR